jgi:hypothetical protein
MVCTLFHISFRIPLFFYVEFCFLVFCKTLLLPSKYILSLRGSELSLFGFDIVGLIGLIIIGVIIILVIRLLLVLIPAALVAFVVWYLTDGNLWWAGIAFLVIAALSILKKLW